jgi:translation initiation factor 1
MDFDIPKNNLDPFTDTSILHEKIHLRVQQRNGKKCITTISGLPTDLDQKRVCKHMRKTFCCNGNCEDDEEHGKIIQLQGDQRANVKEWLLANEIVKDESYIVVHGG